MDKKALSRQIREMRRARRLTQAELADVAGVAVKVIQEIEHERANPTISTLEALAKALNVDLVNLLGKDQSPRARRTTTQKQTPDVNSAAQLLIAYAMLSPERKAIVNAIVFDDEAYLSEIPGAAQWLESLSKD